MRPNPSATLLAAFLTFLCLLSASPTRAADPGGSKAAVSTPTRVTTVEGITEYRLNNGLRVLLAPDGSKPTVTVNIVYLVGSRYEAYGETGMAHLLEHLLFKGTPSLPDGALVSALKARGMSFNGTTWYDRTNYYETFTASDDNLDWALKMEADRMVNSFIARKDLDSEMTVVRNEMESGENSPARILEQRVHAAAYQWHNYGKDTIGARSDVEQVNIEHLQAFYRKYYQPDNAVLVVTGKFDDTKVLGKVAAYFGAIPKPVRSIEATWTRDPVQDGERQVMLSRVGDYQLIELLYHIPNGAHPDVAALNVLASVLTDTPSGRLHKALVETKQAATVSADVYELAEPGHLTISVTVDKNGSLATARQTLLATLDELAVRPVTEEELQRAKLSHANTFDKLLDNPQRLAIALTGAISQGDWRLLFLERDQIAAVTRADLQRVAANYLKATNRTVGIFVPGEQADRVAMPAEAKPAELLNSYAGHQAVAAGESFDPSPANIDARTRYATLSNGARLALLPKKTRGSTVNGVLRLGFGDADSLLGLQTAAEIGASMLTRGGGDLNRQQIADRLKALKATVSFHVSDNYLVANFETRRDSLPAFLDLLADLMRRPSFPGDEFEQLRSQILTAVESGRSDPQSVAGRALARHGNTYPAGDWRYARTIDEDLDALRRVKLEDIGRFYRDFVAAQNANIALVGDFDAQAVQAQLERRFGDWRSGRGFARIPDPLRAEPPTKMMLETPDKANAVYFARLRLPINDQSEAAPALLLANRIFGGGGLKSRLGDRLRQKEGISYGVGSQLSLNSHEESSTLQMYAIYAPQNLDRLKQAFAEETARVLRDGVTGAELADARQGLLQERLIGRSNDAGLAAKLGSYLELGRTLAWDAALEDKLQAVQVAQINAALRRYLDPEAMANVYAGDFAKAATAVAK